VVTVTGHETTAQEGPCAWDANKMNTSLIIYTSVFGDGYNLPRVRPTSGVDYVCFTDQQNLEANNWIIEVVQPILTSDPARSSRDPKIRPHIFLRDYTRSIYIDPSVEIICDPLELWNFLVNSEDIVFGAMLHSFRDTLRNEFRAVLSRGLDSEHILAEQFMAYKELTHQALELRPVWGGMLARRHNAPECINAMEKWFASVLRYSRRDQLSLPIILSEMSSGVINLRDCSIHETEFHKWPIEGYSRAPRYYTNLDILNGSSILPWYSYIRSRLKMKFIGNRKVIPHAKLRVELDDDHRKESEERYKFDKESGLFCVEESSPERRIYVSNRKRLKLYHEGIDYRLKWLLRDYRIPEDLIRPGDFVIDIGANNGELGIWTTMAGAQYMGFEPDPIAFRALSNNVDSQHLFDIALSDENGIADFYLSTEEADSSLFRPENNNISIQVEKRTLDSFLNDLEDPLPDRIRLVKIEAEGMEPEVVAGALETLRRAEFVAVDAGPERGGENTVPEVLNKFSKEGFSIVACFLLRGTFFLRNDDLPHEAVPVSKLESGVDSYWPSVSAIHTTRHPTVFIDGRVRFRVDGQSIASTPRITDS